MSKDEALKPTQEPKYLLQGVDALLSAAGTALEVLEKHRQMKGEPPMGMLGVRAMEELKEAFRLFRSQDDDEQPEQEQVKMNTAGADANISHGLIPKGAGRIHLSQPAQEPVATMKMLHTYGDTTPQQRPWVGLTPFVLSDEDKRVCFDCTNFIRGECRHSHGPLCPNNGKCGGKIAKAQLAQEPDFKEKNT